MRALIRDLHKVSGDFAVLWAGEDEPRPVADRLTVGDPRLGRFTLDKDVLVVEPGDLRVVVLSVPADSPDADRLGAIPG